MYLNITLPAFSEWTRRCITTQYLVLVQLCSSHYRNLRRLPQCTTLHLFYVGLMNCSVFYNYSDLKAIFYFHTVYQLNLIEIAKYAKRTKLFSNKKWSYLQDVYFVAFSSVCMVVIQTKYLVCNVIYLTKILNFRKLKKKDFFPSVIPQALRKNLLKI